MSFLEPICEPNHALLGKAEADAEEVMDAMQCRAARGLLQWNQNELAAHAGISGTTIRNFENGVTNPNPATLVVLRQTFEKAGVEFINGDQPGVRMRKKPGRIRKTII
jgi:DNA-binding transcriptional regulator YiaG